MKPLPDYWNELNFSEKLEWIVESTSFRYIFDGNHLSSGVFWSDEMGPLAPGGGAFESVIQAIEAFERFEQCLRLSR